MPPEETTLELARQGNPDAIAVLINSQLQPKGITARVAFEEGCLQILLTSGKALNQETLVPYIQQGVVALGAESISQIRISGQQALDIKPSWSQEVTLNEPAVPDMDTSASEFDGPETSDLLFADFTSEDIRIEEGATSDSISSLDLIDLEFEEMADSTSLDLEFSLEGLGEPEEASSNFSGGELDELAFADATQEMSLEGLDPTLATTALDLDFDLPDLDLGDESESALSLAEFDEPEPAISDLSDFDLSDFPVSESIDSELSLEDLTSEDLTSDPVSSESDFDLGELSLENALDQSLSLGESESSEPSSELVDFDLSDFSVGESVENESTGTGLSLEDLDEPASLEMSDFDLTELSLEDELGPALSLGDVASETEAGLENFAWFETTPEPADPSSFEESEEPDLAAEAMTDFDLPELSLGNEADPAFSLEFTETPEVESEPIDFDLSDFSPSSDHPLGEEAISESDDSMMLDFELADLPLPDSTETAPTEDFDALLSEATESTDFDLADFSLNETADLDLTLEGLDEPEIAAPTASDLDLGDLWLENESDAAFSLGEFDPSDPTPSDASPDFDLTDFPSDEITPSTALDLSSDSSLEDMSWSESTAPETAAFNPTDLSLGDELDLDFSSEAFDTPTLDAAESADFDLGDFSLDEPSEPNLALEDLEAPESASSLAPDLELGDLWLSEESNSFSPEVGDASDPLSADAMLDFDLADLSEIGSEEPSESASDSDLFQEDLAVEDFDTPESTNSEMAGFDLADLSFEDEPEEVLSFDTLDAPAAGSVDESDVDLADFSFDEGDASDSLSTDSTADAMLDFDLTDLSEIGSEEPSESASDSDLFEEDLAVGDFDTPESTNSEMASFDLADLSFEDEPEEVLSFDTLDAPAAEPVDESDVDLADFSLSELIESSDSALSDNLSLEGLDDLEQTSSEMAEFNLADLSFGNESNQNLSLEDLDTSDSESLAFMDSLGAEATVDLPEGEFIDPFAVSPLDEQEETPDVPLDDPFMAASSPFNEQEEMPQEPVDSFTMSPFEDSEDLPGEPEAFTTDADDMAGFDLADLSFSEDAEPDFSSGPASFSESDLLLEDADLESADFSLDDAGAEDFEDTLTTSGPDSFDVPEFSVADLSPEGTFDETASADGLETIDIPTMGSEPDLLSLDESLDEGDEALYPSSQDADAAFPVEFADDAADELPADLLDWQDPLGAADEALDEGDEALYAGHQNAFSEGTDDVFPAGFADDAADELPADLLDWRDPLETTNGLEFEESSSGSGVGESSNGAPAYRDYGEPQGAESEDWTMSGSEPEQDIFVFDDDGPSEISSNGQMTLDPTEGDSLSEADTFVEPSPPDIRTKSSKKGKGFLLPLLGGAGVLLAGLLAFGLYKARTPETEPITQPQPTETSRPDPTASSQPAIPTPETTPQPPVAADPFRDAVNAAGEASQLVQTAQTSGEWKQVADTWQRAVDLMKQVPESSPNYAIAQQKAAEYLPNLQYAQQSYERLTASPSQ